MGDEIPDVGELSSPQQWALMVVKVPATPSRHRVAVWRELRRSGAVPLGQGVWALPDLPVCEEGVARVRELVSQGKGDMLVLRSGGHTGDDSRRLAAVFSEARDEEWAEFYAECGHFLAEIAKEIAKDKLTLAELEEEEQSLERLRRWYRELKVRDLFGASSASLSEQRLKHCTERLEDYAKRVYDAVHQP
jgi:DNA-binding transcriptional regulator PaaX